MDRDRKQRFPKIGAITVVLILLLVVYAVRYLGNVPDFREEHAAEVCRKIVPALHIEQAPVEIVTTQVRKSGEQVRVDYRLKIHGRTGRLRWLACTFDPGAPIYGEPQINALETDAGELGPGKLFVIRRWWLEQQNPLPYVGEERGRLRRPRA